MATDMRFSSIATGFTTLLLACGTATTTDGKGPLVLQAYGGPAGTVAADVPTIEAGVGPQQTCTSPMTVGACQFVSCQPGGIGDPAFGYGNYGPMSASVGGTTVPMPYADQGYPTIGFPSSVALTTGGMMKFHGDGGTTIPAFDVTATIPGLGVITSPVPATAGGTTVIDSTQDLTVTWMPISAGVIQFQLTASDSSGELAASLSCTFDGAAGTGVVAQALLSSLKADDRMNPLSGNLSSALDATHLVDGFAIVTQSFQQGSSPSFGQFAVTLQ